MPPRVVSTPLPAPGEVPAWRDLASRAAEPNPFFEPEFVEAAVTYLEPAGVSLLVVREGDDWIGCLPVRPARLGGILSWRHPYCFLGTPLVDRDRAEPALAALLEHACRAQRSGMLMLDQVADGPVLAAARDAAAGLDVDVVFETAHERAALRRRDEPTYTEGMRAHRRRELQRMTRRLEEELEAPLEVEDRAGQPGSVEKFLQIEASGWKGEAGTALGSARGHAAFFSEVCKGFAASGRLQLLALAAGGRTVAMKCNLAAGDELFCFKIGHDSDLRRYSPGVQLEKANVDVFHDQREERLMDSCADPANEMINRLWPDRRGVTSLVLTRRGARSLVSRHGLRAVQALRTRERRNPSPRS
jgi:CelD/BcsL family acetyltransferase involved in cellulose biosynthesis